MKDAWKAGMECVSGFFISQSSKDLERACAVISPEIRSSMEEAIAGWRCVLDERPSSRRKSVDEKESLHGTSWGASFSRTLTGRFQQDWPHRAYAFQPGRFFFARFARTCESRQSDVHTMRFPDCVLKFGDSGTIVEDDAMMQPRICRYYQFFEFELIDAYEKARGQKLQKNLPDPFRLHGAEISDPVTQK